MPDTLSYGNFAIRDCPEREHRVIRISNNEYAFKHVDDSVCSRMRKMEWYELKDTFEPTTGLFAD